MNEETKIAKENVRFGRLLNPAQKSDCLKHKQICERWLEYEKLKQEKGSGKWGRGYARRTKDNEKIIDLKQAIKEYEKNGI